MENIKITNDDITPLNKTVLIDPMLKPKQTAEGLQLPNQQDAENTPTIATVLKVGPKVVLVKPGDKIVMRRYASDKIIYNGAGGESFFWLIEEDGILGIIK